MKAIDVINRNARKVASIGPDETLQEAIDRLNEANIGSLLVMEGEKVLGIITERDVLRACFTRSPRHENITVREKMTSDIITGSPNDTVADLLKLMTDRKIRHLPVMEGEKLVGLLSLGDLVVAQLQSIRAENEQLRDFIQSSGSVAH